MFFDILDTPRRTETFIRELPPVPDTLWQPPAQWPELRGANVIGIDCETKETDFDHGPGWARGEGHIIGVSLSAVWANGSRGKWYFPLRHEVERENNIADSKTFFTYLREQLSTSIPKCGANLLYDYGWLATEGVYPAGMAYDVQFAEALIDEEGRTALDNLGYKYLHRGKTKDVCKDWVLKAYRGANETNWRGFLWRTPPRLVGPYAEDDADLPIDILVKQWEIMSSENTLNVFFMECRLIPLLIKMRLQGIPVDLAEAELARVQVQQEAAEYYNELSRRVGFTVDNVTAPTQLVKMFDSVGIPYPRTKPTKGSPNGKPSFKKEWLKLLSDDPQRDPSGIGALINEIRECEKLTSTFIDGYILDRAKRDGTSNGRGRVYCSFNPLRDDEGGAKTGRFASSDPNLQNIPSRTKRGKRLRKCFPHEQDHVSWHKKDYSQIEYRLFAHFAVGHGSDEIRYKYASDPSTDYHNSTALDVAELRADKRHFLQMTQEMRDASEEWSLFRKPIKNVNFGLIYGQTEASLAFKAGWSKDEATQFFTSYHGRLPFVRETMKAIQAETQYYGYITTIMGRRTRFNRWEAMRYGERDGRSYAYDEAIRRIGSNIRRAFTYRAVNYRFQGSAADILKASMVRCFEDGVYAVTGIPKITVHDELGWSKPSHNRMVNEAYEYASHIMETVIPLRVPLKVDSTEGETWGHCK